jgi:hypothetical protein
MKVKHIIGALALALLIVPSSLNAQQGEWTKNSLSELLPGGERSEEPDQTFVGRIIERDGRDDDGNPITEFFLEGDEGGLVPLPCKVRERDGGLVGAARNALDDSERCGDFVGERVELVGDVQSITKGTRRIKRLGRIAKITVL